MKIPLPCDFGELLIIKNGIRILQGVSWYKWTDCTKYTYFFSNNNKWGTSEFLDVDDPAFRLCYQVDDALLIDGFLKDKGYPIRGRGYLCGMNYVDGQLYGELLLTDMYYQHIRARCTKAGEYMPEGELLVPPSWDTEEKQRSIILKQCGDIDVRCLAR